MENLARYIIRASFSQERMTYLDHEATVVYTAKACPGPRSGKVDPLTCPKCQGVMRIISFIEDAKVIKTILKYLGIWLVRLRPPKIHDPPAPEYVMNNVSRQPMNDSDGRFYRDPEYAWDAYIQL